MSVQGVTPVNLCTIGTWLKSTAPVLFLRLTVWVYLHDAVLHSEFRNEAIDYLVN